jgi:hypothetical protein
VEAKIGCTSIGRAIFSRIWEDERHLQETVTSNTPAFQLVAPFSTDSVFITTFTPIGCAIFNRIWGDKRKYTRLPILLVAPFSTDYIF